MQQGLISFKTRDKKAWMAPCVWWRCLWTSTMSCLSACIPSLEDDTSAEVTSERLCHEASVSYRQAESSAFGRFPGTWAFSEQLRNMAGNPRCIGAMLQYNEVLASLFSDPTESLYRYRILPLLLAPAEI
nr:hypothetical protein CFP56_74315 [Quercus suber]